MEKQQFTRLELYELVWLEPVSTIASRLNIAESEIRNLCKIHNIPLPQNGYWSKLKFGKSVNRIPLPEKPEESLIIPSTKSQASPKNSESDELSISFPNEKHLFKVPQKLKDPDKLILSAKKSLDLETPSEYGRDRRVIARSGDLDIRVTQQNIERALCFMDALIKILKARKHNVIVKYDTTYVVIDGIEIKIQLREKQKNEKSNGSYSSVYVPLNILMLKVGFVDERTWQDGKKRLEDHLSSIILYLELKGKEKKIERERYAEIRRINEEKEKKEKEQKERINNELKDFKVLLYQTLQWKMSQFLNEFLHSISNVLDPNDEWLQWAKQKSSWFDPFVKKPDQLLDSFSREEIMIDIFKSNQQQPSNSYYFQNNRRIF